MRFTLTPELHELRRDAAAAFERLPQSVPQYPGERRVAVAEREPGRAKQLAELLDGLWDAAPEPGDDRVLRAALVAEAAGGTLSTCDIAEATVSHWLAATSPIVRELLDAEEHVSAFATGEAPVDLRRTGGHYALHGRAVVLRACDADRVLLPARQAGSQVLVSADLAGDGVDVTERHSVELHTSVLDVEFVFHRLAPDRVLPMPGTPADLTALGRVVSAAELLGTMCWATERAVERARGRQQFGRPIGSFQAVAHQCADMLCTVELCRSLVYAAAASHDGHGVPGHRLAASAWLLAQEESQQVVTTALHLFGADGLRWAEPMHLQLRRCQLLRQLWGAPRAVAKEVAERLAEDVTGRALAWQRY